MVAPETLTSWLYAAVGDLWRHSPWVPRKCYSHIIVVSFCRLLLSALLVIHLRTVTRCRRPPAPELAAREFRSHDLSLALDCSLLPYCSPLLCIAAAHGSWHGVTIMLAHRLTCRVQSSAVSCGKTKISRNSAVALTGLLWSAGWSCTNAIRDFARRSPV